MRTILKGDKEKRIALLSRAGLRRVKDENGYAKYLVFFK